MPTYSIDVVQDNNIDVEDISIATRAIKDKYEHLKICFDSVDVLVQSDIAKSKFPMTVKALYNGSKKVDEQFSAFQYLGKSSQYYTCNIIYRTIIEHFLVIYYIGIKCISTQTDETARIYYSDYSLKEIIKQFFTQLDIESMLKRSSKFDDQAKIEMFNVAYKDRISPINSLIKEQVYIKSAQFNERNIIKFLTEKSNKITIDNWHLAELLESYNITSSNVHCGPTSEALFYNKPNYDQMRDVNNIQHTMCQYYSFCIRNFLLQILVVCDKRLEYRPIGIGLNLIQELYSQHFMGISVSKSFFPSRPTGI